MEEKDESKEITLLKEIHQKEIRKLKDKAGQEKWIYNFAIENNVNSSKRIKESEKELEEELLVEHLETRVKKEEKTECHLNVLEVAQEWKDNWMRN